MSIRIKIFKEGQVVKTESLDEGTYKIGRSEKCDIVLSDPSISREHIELRVTASTIYLSNLSTSGKMVLNRDSIETAEFREGDELQVGSFTILLATNASESEAAAASAAVSQSAFQVEGSAALKQEEQFESEPEPQADPPIEAEPANSLPQDPNIDFGDPFGVESNDAEPRVQKTSVNMADHNKGTRGSFSAHDTVIEQKPLIGKLVFTEGPRKGDEIKLDAYEITMGRSKRADIYINDTKLSRTHVKITRAGMGYRLVDMGSRNGTLVNGVRVLEHPLSSFDDIQLGKSKIKFIVHDLGAGLESREDSPTGTNLVIAETKSVQMEPGAQAAMMEKYRAPEEEEDQEPELNEAAPTKKAPKPVIIGGALVLLLSLLFLFQDDGKKASEPDNNEVAQSDTTDPVEGGETPQAELDLIPPTLPKEFAELNSEMQLKFEGLYQSALRAGEAREFNKGLSFLDQIHRNLSFYKNSKNLEAQYQQEIKRESIANARIQAEKNDKQDLQIYLKDGLEYLKTGQFERARESFSAALSLDPENRIAITGNRAADLKIKDINQVPAEVDPELEKRKKVAGLFEQAASAFLNKSYQEAIQLANRIKSIPIEGNTDYLREADNIIERARYAQKEEFEPFLIQAKEKYAEGDYNAARDLCEEMIKRDPAYNEAKELLGKTKRQLSRLAKEAYVYGYILESMNKIEEAKNYWNRAKNYVRPGDSYYDKVMKKLEYYQ